jgi:hypothetical protein
VSSLHSRQWRCLRGRPGLASLKAAVWVLLAPAVAITQDSPDFILPDLDSDLLLVAELVEAKVTFIDPTGIGAVNDLQFGMADQDLANIYSVTVPPDSGEGGTKRSAVEYGPQSAASLTVKTAPGRPITILVDEVVAGDGISLADFRCNYNSGGDTPCDGPGYTETSVGSGTLLVGVTLIAKGNAVAGASDGSFDVTISYQ